jgi:hypothetical protein
LNLTQRRTAIAAMAAELGALPHHPQQVGDLVMRQIKPEELLREDLFMPGVYARGLSIPAHRIVVGKIHLHDHLSFGWGDISVYTPGEGVQRLTGHWWMPAKAGTQRAVFTHADTFWCAVHPNPDDCRDLGALETRYIAPDFDALDAALMQRKLQEALA